MIVAVVGNKEVKQRRHLDAIPDERILAAMEVAGLLQPLDDNVADAMDGLRDQMSPEDVEGKRQEIINAIEVGRHGVVAQLDDEMLTLLTRSATGEVTFIKASKLKH